MTHQFDTRDVTTVLARLKGAWGWLVAFGILSLVGGFLSFANPLGATITVDYLVAIFFLILGAAQIAQAYTYRNWGGFLWTVAVGALTILVGAVMIKNPMEGAASLTLLVALLLFLLGIAKIAYSFAMRPISGWIWVLISGLLSILLGAAIFGNFPWAAGTVLGLFLGVELTFNGVALLLTGLALRNS